MQDRRGHAREGDRSAVGAGQGVSGAQGASDAEIGRRLGVAHTTVSRGLGPRRQAQAGDDAAS